MHEIEFWSICWISIKAYHIKCCNPFNRARVFWCPLRIILCPSFLCFKVSFCKFNDNDNFNKTTFKRTRKWPCGIQIWRQVLNRKLQSVETAHVQWKIAKIEEQSVGLPEFSLFLVSFCEFNGNDNFNKTTFKRTRSLSNAVCFKHDNNVGACAVSALILLPVVNLSVEMDSATSIS